MKLQVYSYGKGVKVNYKSSFSRTTHIGNNCHFNGIVIGGGGKVTIGDNFHSGTDCRIISQNHNYDKGSALPYDNTYVYKDVAIGRNVWLGDRVIVLPGTVIEDGVIVQAGSVCMGTLPYCSICGGHPAKPFKYRDIEHYEELEKQRLYH